MQTDEGRFKSRKQRRKFEGKKKTEQVTSLQRHESRRERKERLELDQFKRRRRAG